MPHPATDELRALLRGRVLEDVPMAGQTTLGVGGAADLLLFPADRQDLAKLLALLRERGVPWVVVGKGSNLLVGDGGIRGAAIDLTEGLSHFEPSSGQPNPTVRAEAGASLRKLVRWAAEQGIGGLEALCGIPGTVGGALAMNAGAWGTEIGERVVDVELLHADGRTERLPREGLRFRYRGLELPAGAVIVEALLEGEAGEPEDLQQRISELLERRRAAQPVGERTAGSVFKNPPGSSAGKLIDDCGLKGVRVGDAEVSRVHANFIVNAGMATAAQVAALMSMIQERVQLRHQIRLEPEIVAVGEWDKPKLRVQE